MPVLGCSFLEESYPSLASQLSGQAKQGEVKGKRFVPSEEKPEYEQGEVKRGRGFACAGMISFVSLVAYGPKVSSLSPSLGTFSPVGEVTAPETR